MHDHDDDWCDADDSGGGDCASHVVLLHRCHHDDVVADGLRRALGVERHPFVGDCDGLHVPDGTARWWPEVDDRHDILMLAIERAVRLEADCDGPG